jgi:deoxyribose-phosphate aldolase
VSFPHGDSTTSIKVAEAENALEDGAVELDMVLNIGWLLSGQDEDVQADIAAVVDVSGDALVKVIFENAYLTDEQKVRACHLTEAAGADYVKTSTGYAPTGATIEDLRLMRANTSPRMKVKAAHGVRTLDALLAVIEAGADRCGATATATMLDDYRDRTSR